MKAIVALAAIPALCLAVAAEINPIIPSTTTAPAVSTGTRSDAWHPGTGDWHRDCDADVQRLCPGITDRHAISQCLDRAGDQVSPACRQMREKIERRWKAEQQERPRRR